MQAPNRLGLFVACIILRPTVAVGPSGLTQPGAPADCVLWYSAKKGDTASGIAANYNIPLTTFIGANPQLSGDPLALWEGYDYCIPEGLKPVSSAISKTSLLKKKFEEIINTRYQPPFLNSSGAIGGNELGPTAGSYGHVGETGLPSEEYGATKDSSMGFQSNTGSRPSTYSQSITDSRSSIGSDSTKFSQSTAESQSTESSLTSVHDQKPTASQSNESLQSSTGSRSAEESEPNIGYQLTKSSQSPTAPPGSESNSEASIMTMSFAAPTKSPSGTQSGTQSDTETESQSGSDSGDLAESFGAARRDLKETETIEPRNLVTERAEHTMPESIRDHTPRMSWDSQNQPHSTWKLP